MSEKSYWVLLISLFTGFSLLVMFVLIPYSVVEYNLGVNLFTSSVFMVMTIVFLTWMINLQEKKKWKRVESMVCREIGVALEHIFRSMVPYYENGMIDWFLFNRLKSGASEAFVRHLDGLLKGDRKLDKTTLRLFLENPKLREREFLDFGSKLGEIETKYFKFLKPEIVESLIKIEKTLSNLDVTASFFVVSNAFMQFASEKGLLNKDQSKNQVSLDDAMPSIDGFFRDILQEIKKLRTLGILIYP